MSDESNEEEMYEIIDLEEDFIDSYVSDKTEAELTKMYEYKDSFLESLDETVETEYSCPLCKDIFVGKQAINEHVKRYFKYKCTACGKQYFRDKYLRNHLKSAHLESKELVCPICNKLFKAVNNLKQHLNLHSSERPYKCDYEGCDKSFKQKPGLHQHIRFMHKKNVNFCTHCRKRVANLEKHLQEVPHKNVKRKRNETNKDKPAKETSAKKARKDPEELEFYDSDTSSDQLSATWTYSSEDDGNPEFKVVFEDEA